MMVYRPCDTNETAQCWGNLMTLEDAPAALVLTRQAVPTVDRSRFGKADGVHRGGYIIAGPGSDGDDENSIPPEVILMSSGSEVHVMLEAHEELEAKGVRVRSLSIPCMELFRAQPQEYLAQLLPNECRARVSVEAGLSDHWTALVGVDGEHVGLNSFGLSGPGKEVVKAMGMTSQSVLAAAQRVMECRPRSMVAGLRVDGPSARRKSCK